MVWRQWSRLVFGLFENWTLNSPFLDKSGFWAFAVFNCHFLIVKCLTVWFPDIFSNLNKKFGFSNKCLVRMCLKFELFV